MILFIFHTSITSKSIIRLLYLFLFILTYQ
nr:MAG TPA_asm: hypothetical protein [Bacteriophage sp.]